MFITWYSQVRDNDPPPNPGDRAIGPGECTFRRSPLADFDVGEPSLTGGCCVRWAWRGRVAAEGRLALGRAGISPPNKRNKLIHTSSRQSFNIFIPPNSCNDLLRSIILTKTSAAINGACYFYDRNILCLVCGGGGEMKRLITWVIVWKSN